MSTLATWSHVVQSRDVRSRDFSVPIGLPDEVQDKVNEICAQRDEPEYKMDEPLEVEETEVEAAACHPTTSKPTAKPRLPTTFCRQHNRAECP